MDDYQEQIEPKSTRPEPQQPAASDLRLRKAMQGSDQNEGLTEVALKDINESDIRSVADFHNPEKHAALTREAIMLKQMQPSLAGGTDVELFHGWDQANQIGHYSPAGYIRGYADVYHSYYGDEAIALEAKADGRYNVINGRHRLAVAREVGLSKVPARML